MKLVSWICRQRPVSHENFSFFSHVGNSIVNKTQRNFQIARSSPLKVLAVFLYYCWPTTKSGFKKACLPVSLAWANVAVGGQKYIQAKTRLKKKRFLAINCQVPLKVFWFANAQKNYKFSGDASELKAPPTTSLSEVKNICN